MSTARLLRLESVARFRGGGALTAYAAVLATHLPDFFWTSMWRVTLRPLRATVRDFRYKR